MPRLPAQPQLPPRCRDPYNGGRLHSVRCQLKTTGGNCAVLVQRSLSALLSRMGLNPWFYFDGDHFQPRAPPRPQVVPKPRPAGARASRRCGRAVCRGCAGGAASAAAHLARPLCSVGVAARHPPSPRFQRQPGSAACCAASPPRLPPAGGPPGACPPAAAPRAEAPTPAEVQAVRAKAAAAGFPSQSISEEQFRQMEAQSVRVRLGLLPPVLAEHQGWLTGTRHCTKVQCSGYGAKVCVCWWGGAVCECV